MPRADLHLHTYCSPDSLSSLHRLVSRCQESGLDCIAVTDHNTIQGARALRKLAPFEVIIGEEIRTTGGDIIGLFLERPVRPGLTPLQAVHAVKEQGGLVSVPHPFDRLRSSVITSSALEEILPHVDMIETFNARNTNPKHDALAADLAAKRNLPGIAVSDSHTVGEVGHTFMDLPSYNSTAEGLLAVLRDARPVCRRASRFVHLSSTYAKLHHRLFGSRPC